MPKNTIVWSDKHIINIKKGNSTEPVKIVEITLTTKDGHAYEYPDPITKAPYSAFSINAKIIVYGMIVPKTIKRKCFQRGDYEGNSCIYEFDVIRNKEKRHVKLPLAGHVIKGQDFFDIDAYWLDYPEQSDVKWVEIPIE